MTFLMLLSVVLLSMLTILLSTLKYDQVLGMLQHLELASELESDVRDTVKWGRKWIFDFNTEKTQLVLFDQSNNTGAIDLKMDGSFLEEK